MKKTVLLFAMFLFAFTSQAQQLEQGNSLINLGAGMGSYYTSGSGYKTTLPPLEASYEYMINDNVSVGGFFGMTSSEYKQEIPDIYNNTTISYKITFGYMAFGGVGNYHFVNNDEFDVYGGIKLGYTNAKIEMDSNDSDFDQILKTLDYKGSGVLFGAQAGARYFFSDNMAVNVELGYGFALAKLGLTIKL